MKDKLQVIKNKLNLEKDELNLRKNKIKYKIKLIFILTLLYMMVIPNNVSANDLVYELNCSSINGEPTYQLLMLVKASSRSISTYSSRSHGAGGWVSTNNGVLDQDTGGGQGWFNSDNMLFYTLNSGKGTNYIPGFANSGSNVNIYYDTCTSNINLEKRNFNGFTSNASNVNINDGTELSVSYTAPFRGITHTIGDFYKYKWKVSGQVRMDIYNLPSTVVDRLIASSSGINLRTTGMYFSFMCRTKIDSSTYVNNMDTAWKFYNATACKSWTVGTRGYAVGSASNTSNLSIGTYSAGSSAANYYDNKILLPISTATRKIYVRYVDTNGNYLGGNFQDYQYKYALGETENSRYVVESEGTGTVSGRNYNESYTNEASTVFQISARNEIEYNGKTYDYEEGKFLSSQNSISAITNVGASANIFYSSTRSFENSSTNDYLVVQLYYKERTVDPNAVLAPLELIGTLDFRAKSNSAYYDSTLPNASDTDNIAVTTDYSEASLKSYIEGAYKYIARALKYSSRTKTMQPSELAKIVELKISDEYNNINLDGGVETKSINVSRNITIEPATQISAKYYEIDNLKIYKISQAILYDSDGYNIGGKLFDREEQIILNVASNYEQIFNAGATVRNDFSASLTANGKTYSFTEARATATGYTGLTISNYGAYIDAYNAASSAVDDYLEQVELLNEANTNYTAASETLSRYITARDSAYNSYNTSTDSEVVRQNLYENWQTYVGLVTTYTETKNSAEDAKNDAQTSCDTAKATAESAINEVDSVVSMLVTSAMDGEGETIPVGLLSDSVFLNNVAKQFNINLKISGLHNDYVNLDEKTNMVNANTQGNINASYTSSTINSSTSSSLRCIRAGNTIIVCNEDNYKLYNYDLTRTGGKADNNSISYTSQWYTYTANSSNNAKTTISDWRDDYLTIPNNRENGTRTLSATIKYTIVGSENDGKLNIGQDNFTAKVTSNNGNSSNIEVTAADFTPQYKTYRENEVNKVNVFAPITVANFTLSTANRVDHTLNEQGSAILEKNAEFTLSPGNIAYSGQGGYNLSEVSQFISGYYFLFDFEIVYTGEGAYYYDRTTNTRILATSNQKIPAGMVIYQPGATTKFTAIPSGNVGSTATGIYINRIKIVAEAINVPNVMKEWLERNISFGDIQYVDQDYNKINSNIYAYNQKWALSDIPTLVNNAYYYASKSMQTKNVTRIFDFMITDCKDLEYKNIFRKNTDQNVNESTGVVFYSGAKKWNFWDYTSENVLTTITNINATSAAATVLPLGPYSIDKYNTYTNSNSETVVSYSGAPKLGYRFSYSLKTSGYIPNDNANNVRKVYITPRYYYISKDGTKFSDSITLYYRNEKNKYLKFEGSGYSIYFTPNDGYRNLNTESVGDLGLGKYFNSYFSSNIEKVDISGKTSEETQYIDNTGNTQAVRGNIVLDNKFMTSNNTYFVQAWYGEFKLPNSTIAVDNSGTTTYSTINNPLRDGYIGIVFDIYCVDNDGTNVNIVSYNKLDSATSNPNTTQWDYEGFMGIPQDNVGITLTNSLQVKLEKGIWNVNQQIYDKVKGTVVLYDIDNSASQDFE